MFILKQLFSSLQKVGKSLMLPVSVLPIAGILLGVGAAKLGFLPTILSTIMEQSGGAIFGNLPLLFAIGVALGFTKNDGVAALSAVVGYVVLLSTMGVMATMQGIPTHSLMGIQSIKTGVFGGIIIGALVATLFNRYYKIELPPYLGFFSGKRFVPIISATSAIGLGVVLSFVWPPIGDMIRMFGHWAANESPEIAFTVYGIVERALIPFGLHHIWNVPFFFETGSFIDPVSGNVVVGELARYVSGDPTAGNLAGGYLFKMWGLPAAAIAIWHTAKPENKKRIAGIMISAALTSFITGITEPIEFAFLFVAPVLYAIHALLSGLAFYVCIAFDIKHGTTFSHGLIDYIVLFGQSKNALWFLLIGPLWASVYYGIFRFAITKFNLATPGRESDQTINNSINSTSNEDFSMAQKLVNAFGGAENILNLDSCITRLRIELKEPKRCNSSELRSLGATGVLTIGSGIQAIFGTNSGNLKTQMEEFLSSRPPATEPTIGTNNQKIDLNVPSIIEFLGGEKNILELDQCATTRIRFSVKDPTLTQKKSLEKNPGPRMIPFDSGVFHLIVGKNAKTVFNDFKKLLPSL